jgi:mannose-6-phosphate isomerase-like protein (cupin superfamily)
MFVKHLKDCREFIAGDASVLREILHPEKADLQINYSLAYAKVLPGQRTKSHSLKTSEVYYILEGDGLMHIDEESCQVTAESTVYIPPNAKQYIENTGKSALKFLCIVDPFWKLENETV